MSAELVAVPVPGADVPLQAVQIDGHTFVALRPLCDSLGVDYSSQLKKLRGRSWATVVLNTMVAADGGSREMVLISGGTMTMWLATLDERRVRDEIRPMIVAYQREATDALLAHFDSQTNNRPTTIDGIRAMLDQIEAAQRDASEARQIAAKTEARLDAIEGKHDWFSAIAYARLHDLPTSTQYLQKLGGCAARIGRARGIEPTQVQHQLYGWVNSWPAWVWDLASDGFDRGVTPPGRLIVDGIIQDPDRLGRAVE